jgi:hypothetical protein
MKPDAFFLDRTVIGGSIAAVLTAVLAPTPGAFGAERMVLGEYFTGTWCPTCAIAGPIVSDIMDLYGLNGTDPDFGGKLAVIQYHSADPYALPWGEDRVGFYNSLPFMGFPTMVYDGQTDAWPMETFVPLFMSHQAIPTPVTMAIYAEEVTPSRYEITVETCLEAGADPVDLRIYTVGAEDYYPSDPSYSRNTFRNAARTVDISLGPGECQEVVNTLIINSVNQNNLRLVAWAQEPNATFPADVYQSAIVGYPFPAPTPCPWDCSDPPDGEVGINDFLWMLAGWDGPGSCDFDDDAVIGITDFLALLAHWGPCP